MKTSHYRIALYPGDGIGIDVTAEAAKVLRAVEHAFDLRFDCTEFPWGCNWAEKHDGKVVPDDFLDMLRDFDAILLGAVGLPEALPDHITLIPLIRMRQDFEQYVCLRPAMLLPGVSTPLANKTAGDIDMVIVRENSEGEYTSTGGSIRVDTAGEISVQTAIHTRQGVERILRYAFQLARDRRGNLAMATKSNALNHSMVMWDRIFEVVADDFPDVKAAKFHIDALTMHFVRCPEQFDVVVASNLFGDILSDLAAALVGSLGLTPSANINPERAFPSLFEPVHGSAPDIAGQGIANPIAAIRSAAMMLDFLGETEAGKAVEKAVTDFLVAGEDLPPDLGGEARTDAVGDAIAQRVTI